jgi:large subunit ribosomal protein L13
MTQTKVERKWYVVDANGQVLGRLASRVASILRGKHKPQYAPHIDFGDHIIVVNAEGIVLTGNKIAEKELTRYSGYPGGLKRISYQKLVKEKPELIVEKAIKGMLPHTRLGRKMAKKLKVYRGPDHPHEAQKPEPSQSGNRQEEGGRGQGVDTGRRRPETRERQILQGLLSAGSHHYPC